MNARGMALLAWALPFLDRGTTAASSCRPLWLVSAEVGRVCSCPLKTPRRERHRQAFHNRTQGFGIWVANDLYSGWTATVTSL